MARILLIDDDQNILNLEKLILSDDGHEVMLAEDALTALDLLSLYEVDLIIVDVQMPRLNGFQFVTTLKNDLKLRSIPIAFLTASREAETVTRAAKLGADFYLLKPIDRRVFIAQVTDFFENKPPKVHPRLDFSEPHSVDIKVRLSAQVLSVSDLGVEILTKSELEDGQVIELPCEIFQGVFSQDPVFKVLWVKSDVNGFNKACLSFLDQDAEVMRRLQRHIQVKNQPKALAKYPKWR